MIIYNTLYINHKKNKQTNTIYSSQKQNGIAKQRNKTGKSK